MDSPYFHFFTIRQEIIHRFRIKVKYDNKVVTRSLALT